MASVLWHFSSNHRPYYFLNCFATAFRARSDLFHLFLSLFTVFIIINTISYLHVCHLRPLTTRKYHDVIVIPVRATRSYFILRTAFIPVLYTHKRPQRHEPFLTTQFWSAEPDAKLIWYRKSNFHRNTTLQKVAFLHY